MEYAIGVDIGVTNIKSVCVTAAGEVIARDQVETHSQSPDWPARVKEVVHKILKERGPIAHLGLAAPGIASPDGKAIWWMQGRLAEVQGLNWTDYLNWPVVAPVLNDAQAALLGESWVGSAAGSRNVALLTLGTGVGGAVMCDGQILRGAIGRAGHLGHISLDPYGRPDVANTPGSLEDEIGNCTIQRRGTGTYASTHELVKAVQAGDKKATLIWTKSLRALAAGISSIINVVDPEIIVIGGGIAACGEPLFTPLGEFLAQFEWRPHGHRARIVPATLGEFAGALGAARNALLTHRSDA